MYRVSSITVSLIVSANLLAQDLNSTPDAQSCKLAYPELIPENIKAGKTIGGIVGTADLHTYPLCSDTLRVNCMTSKDYPAIKTSGLAAKVSAGETVAGVTGTAAAESRSDCSSDGETNCVTNLTYPSVKVADLARKIISGNTVGGIAGTATEETRSECTGANQEDCIATSTYKTMDLSNKDGGGSLDLTDTNFETRVKSASTFEYWDQYGNRHTNTGDTDITAANIDTGITIFGTAGTAVAPDCSSIGVGGGWILVPGDPDFGTNDFCVMKYEAKCSFTDGSTCAGSASTENPTSTAANTPWVNINQQDAIMECTSLGKGYHLITNDEWMTIATNLAAQGNNWDGGTVGINEMSRGHSDNNPSSACEADANDANAYVETDCATGRSSSGTFNQRRTHILSNGEVIWDLAGNVWEWTSYFNDSDKPNAGVSWIEYSGISSSTSMPATDLAPNNAIKSFWNDGWNSAQSIGRYFPGPNGSGGGLLRGAVWSDNLISGLFSAFLHRAPTGSDPLAGFRCTVEVP